jgi:hypothetical protein
MKKQKSHAFGKDIYLLGTDSDKQKYWLEAPKWDCDWYWGFGYVETYTNNRNPFLAKDIKSHRHIDNSFIGQHEYYDGKKDAHCLGKYIHNIYDSPLLKEKTFSKEEGWQLSELFKQFYLLKEMAEFCHRERPSCHVTTSPVDHGNMHDWYDKINYEMIPKITEKILTILSPEN